MLILKPKLNFLIIGAQKAGTTSLAKYLSQHKSILPPKEKEFNFFNLDQNYQKGKSYYESNLNRYRNPFKPRISFEATTHYLYLPHVAQRIYSYNPNFKLIILLREPSERDYSAWNMYRPTIKECTRRY